MLVFTLKSCYITTEDNNSLGTELKEFALLFFIGYRIFLIVYQ